MGHLILGIQEDLNFRGGWGILYLYDIYLVPQDMAYMCIYTTGYFHTTTALGNLVASLLFLIFFNKVSILGQVEDEEVARVVKREVFK